MPTNYKKLDIKINQIIMSSQNDHRLTWLVTVVSHTRIVA